MDWSLRACGRHGHVTYAPDDPALRGRLRADTAMGEAWRCLRCGDFVVGEVHGSGPAGAAPIVLRGRALRDATILRLIAVFRWVKGVLVLAAAYGVWRFRADHDAVNRAFKENLPLLQPLADRLGWHLDQSGVVHTVRTVLAATTTTLTWIMLALIALGTLWMIEGLGLWLLKRWGEYFSVIATSSFIPVEVHELVEKITPTRVIILLINIAVVLYIALSKRLFGLRGGRAAHEEERREASILEVEAATVARDTGGGSPGTRPAARRTDDGPPNGDGRAHARPRNPAGDPQSNSSGEKRANRSGERRSDDSGERRADRSGDRHSNGDGGPHSNGGPPARGPGRPPPERPAQ
ncbi:DUF2127 domain-containing protein [Planotetraspora kaengkrachanensis]|uniref:DUF2127 domain-containing protein n=1 Tax=Planotetraspora kaengkrachanensis TaxID=575193 RepID=A0A8J3LRX9_9ACTN|nr:DUF2127 domain-containing protein [Planotetraspora kaengkrachanensis]GIG76942.1 hypothetical protein Pka01_00690 [Planotetraspora kaengkrachanensis]